MSTNESQYTVEDRDATYLLDELSKAKAEKRLREEQLPHDEDAPWDYDDDRHDWDLRH
ncbi:hypothetical protein B9479_008322 [Cryptococcus floricola]|uniref:Uncharacterized protein n=1 Tax=Cryptococcus floricola TaxID=2591691 RepID=A0A5D3AM81_9TREE|nr:hypothetical protein B9479_008322 [Cryptococcus floricola]